MNQQPRSETAALIPDTPAGKQFDHWLKAFNSGKRDVMRRFVAERFEKEPDGKLNIDDIVDNDLALYKTSRGFDVKKIAHSESASISVIVQSKWTGYWMQIDFFTLAEAPDFTKAKAPYSIVGKGTRYVEAPPELLPKTALTLADIAEKTNSLVTKLAAVDAFAGTVVIAKDGKPFYKRAVGLASRAWKIPNHVDTRFNLASITKMFTAVAVAQLVERGKLSYDDPIGKIFPNYPNADVAKRVTLHHLLSHTSGMIGARASVEKLPAIPTARTLSEMTKPFEMEPLSFTPGQRYDYSNAGFILLGAVIEKASGQSYHDFVRQHIFELAGMKNTDFYSLDTDPGNIAEGLADGPNHTRLNNIFDLGVIGSPAGGAYSTGEDIVRFHQALVQHRLVSQSSLKTLWTGVTERSQGEEYGYGAQIAHYNGTNIVWHGGGWKGITDQFDLYPELGYTVVILSNIDDDPAIIALALRGWLTQSEKNATPTLIALPAIKVSVTASGQEISQGQSVTFTVTVSNQGGPVHSGIVDLEVKDGGNAKAHQQFTMDQKIETGQTRTYTYSWTPVTPGAYTVDVAVFGPGWRTKHLFSLNLLKTSCIISDLVHRQNAAKKWLYDARTGDFSNLAD